MKHLTLLTFSALAFCQVGTCGPATIKHLAQIPIGFEPNLGQAPVSERFVSRGLEYSLSLSESGANLRVSTGKSLDIQFVNSNLQPHIQGTDSFSYKSNYFVGNNPEKWLKDVPNFAKVRYSQVWKGIDLVFYGNHTQLEYDLVVSPGANPEQAAILFPGAAVHVNKAGDLIVQTVLGDFVQKRPLAYQLVAGERHAIGARYRVSGNHIRFAIGKYDPALELVIDPQLTYSIGQIDPKYITASGVGVDNSGNSYVGGTTSPIAVNPMGIMATNAWLAKLDAQGNILLTAAVGAADGGDVTVNAFTTDPAGNVYITGSTTSTSPKALPVPNGFQTAPAGGGTDAFLMKIATVGNHVGFPYGTYFGGTGADSANAISVPVNDLVLIAGQTNSPNIHNTTSQMYAGGNSDAFAARINTFASGANSLIYSTFLGGSGDDSAQAVSADFTGVAYVAGKTTSTDFHPTSPNGFNTVKTTSNTDGFLVKLTPVGAAATYFTYYTSGPISAIATDLNANAFIAGTAAGFIPTNSVIPGYQVSNGTGHGFVARLNTNTTGVNSLAYASYLGGNGFDTANAIATDGNAKAFVTGSTTSSNFPTLNPTQGSLAGNTNAFVTVLDTTKSGPAGLTFSTYLGGSGPDLGTAIAVDQNGNPIVAGQSSSPNFPVTPGKPEGGSNTRAFTSKILFETALQFVPIAPCRILDTRNATGTFGGPFLAGGVMRSVPVQSSTCGIPASAQAYALNMTVVPRTSPLGYLTVWPSGQPQPFVSTLNSPDGSVLANAAIVPAGSGGSVNVYASNDTELVIDINGYFTPPGGNSLQFYPLTPCRVADTRNAIGAFGGPFIAAGTNRSFVIPSSSCAVPASAQAFSFNVTVVPHGSLGYLTAWPTGQAQPVASTLNSLDGTVLANAAIVPGGPGGAVSFYASNDTDLVLDINGYFAPPGTGGLNFYTLTPCRVVDTRNPNGPFGGPIIAGNTSRSFPLPAAACGLPATASAYSLNMTVVPQGPLGFLTVWPTGQPQPGVSTLNALKGIVIANAAIVPAGIGGAISVFAANPTHVVIDANGYFAQ